MRWVFWIAVAVIGYAYVGYPLWLWMRSWWCPRPVRRGKYEPSVAAILVVKNEERTIKAKIQNLLGLEYPADKLQIIVVSDGSSDGTEGVLQEFANDPRIRVIVKSESKGKAAGLNDAVKAATGEVLLFTDARQKIEPPALRILMENLADPEVGCASGELMLGSPEAGEAGQGMGVYWRIEKKIRDLESSSGSVVGATGAIYCVRLALVESLPEGTLLDDVLLPMQVVRKGSRVVFEPEARAWDNPDLGASREFSRKVRTLTGNYQLLQLAPWLLGSENAIRFQFISHKLCRLAVPFALIAALIAPIFLAGVVYRAIWIAQIVFYGLSGAAILGLKIGPLSRIADTGRTFVVLNSAAAVAFVQFVSGRKVAWSR